MDALLPFVLLVHVSQHASAVDLYTGEHYLLPCEFPTFELDTPATVVWSRSDLSPSTVHQRRREGDDKSQNQLYRGRTSMVTNALDTGDLSLNLTDLQPSDSGTYTCSVTSARGQWKIADIQLKVKENFPLWAKVLLVLLAVVLIVAGSLLAHFRQYFMSVYRVKLDSGVPCVKLPCKALVPVPANAKVEWIFRLSNKVHVCQNGKEQLEDQYSLCSGRIKRTRIQPGTRDLSLSLSYPADEDSGTYTCTVYVDERIILKKKVELQVTVYQKDLKDTQEFVLLPFKTTENLPTDTVVEWKRYEPTYKIVHKYPSDYAPWKTQSTDYTGRTTMANEPLKSGDLSLTLKWPTKEDTGRYVCGVWRTEAERILLRNKTVLLKVEAVEQKQNRPMAD